MSDPNPSPSDEPIDNPDLEAWQIEAQLPAVLQAEQHDLAAALGERLLELREAALGPAHPKTLEAATDLAESHFRLSRHPRAVELLERALQAYEAEPAPEPLKLGSALAQLAKVHRSTGALDRAEALYQRALDAYKTTAGATGELAGSAAEGTATVLHGLAIAQDIRGQRAEAERSCRAALEIRERILGRGSIVVAESLDVLAILHRKKGELDEAERLYQRSLSIWEAAKGKDHPGLAVSLTNLGVLYTEKNEHAKAGEALARATALLDARGGARDALSAGLLDALGNHHEALEEHAAAIDAARRALALYEELLGPSHGRVAIALNNLATKLLAAGEAGPGEAEALLRRALHIIGDTPVGSTFGTTLLNLASLRITAGDLGEATTLANRVLDGARRARPSHGDLTAAALVVLSRIFEARGDIEQALHGMQLAFQLRSERPQLDQAIADMTRIGTLMLAADEPEEASKMLRDALDLAGRSRGQEHPSVGHLIFLAAKVAVAQENPEHALFCAGTALEILQKAKGRTHPDLVEVLVIAGQAELELGKLDEAEAAFRRIAEIHAAHAAPESEAQAIAPALLGDVAMQREAHAEAAELYETALAIADRAFGKDSLRLQVLLDKAAEAHLVSRDFERTEELSLRLMALYEAAGTAPDDPVMRPSVQRLSRVYMETDRPGLAAKMIRREMNVIEAQTRELRAKLSRAIAEEAREKGQS